MLLFCCFFSATNISIGFARFLQWIARCLTSATSFYATKIALMGVESVSNREMYSLTCTWLVSVYICFQANTCMSVE